MIKKRLSLYDIRKAEKVLGEKDFTREELTKPSIRRKADALGKKRFAKKLGVSARTTRYWKASFIPKAKRPPGMVVKAPIAEHRKHAKRIAENVYKISKLEKALTFSRLSEKELARRLNTSAINLKRQREGKIDIPKAVSARVEHLRKREQYFESVAILKKISVDEAKRDFEEKRKLSEEKHPEIPYTEADYMDDLLEGMVDTKAWLLKQGRTPDFKQAKRMWKGKRKPKFVKATKEEYERYT